jgi:hypothetical protein
MAIADVDIGRHVESKKGVYLIRRVCESLNVHSSLSKCRTAEGKDWMLDLDGRRDARG